jgi:carboxypeptidase T
MSGGTFYYPPDEFIARESKRNWEAAMFAARIADCPTRIVGVNCS